MLFGNKKKEIDKKEFEKFGKKITINDDADAFFEELEQAASSTKYVVIEQSMHDYGPEQIIMRFLDKYKGFVEFYYTDMMSPHGKTYIKLKKVISFQDKKDYSELEDSYTEEYYMNDCGGYDSFKESNGTVIEQRLQDVYNLVNPQKGDNILDIGCGRGELSYALADSGAFVTGVDYSADAIKIAKRTFDGKKDNLKYIQADIFEMKNIEEYDKIVMADVVEHIDQDILERIFGKLSDSMTDDGILIVHTAPNRDYYDYVYPKRKQSAAQMGLYIPKNPRSYYEQLMHINEQNPQQLKNALNKCFKYVKVWTGTLAEMNAEKTFEEECEDNQIFAFACKNQDVLLRTMDEVTRRPELDKCNININALNQEVSADTKEVLVDVTLTNDGEEVITSRRKYPINLSYHVIDENGEYIVFDGERTNIGQFIRKGQAYEIPMNVKLPDSVKLKKYTLRITMVAEGCFWLDQNNSNYKDITLNVKR